MEIHYFSRKHSKTPHSFEAYYMRYNFIWADRSFYLCHTGLCLSIAKSFPQLNMDEIICALKLIQRDNPLSINESQEDLEKLFTDYENYTGHQEELQNGHLQEKPFSYLKNVLTSNAENRKDILHAYATESLKQYQAYDLLDLSSIGRIINVDYSMEDYYEQTSEFPFLSKISNAIKSPDKLLLLDYRKMEQNIPSLIFDELSDEFKLYYSFSYPLFTLPIIQNNSTEELRQIRKNLLPVFSQLKHSLKKFKTNCFQANWDKDFHGLLDFYNSTLFPEWCRIQPHIHHDEILKNYYNQHPGEKNTKLSLSMTINMLPLKAILKYFIDMDIVKEGHDHFIRSMMPKHFTDNTPIPFLSLSFGKILWNKDILPD